MKLALVTETFPPEVNGVAMTLGRLCEELAGRGWRILVARPEQEGEEPGLPRPPKSFEELVVPGLPLPGYKGLRMGEPTFFSLRSAWKRLQPDIVHVATEGPLGVAALLAGKALDLPIISTFHTNFDQYSGHYRVGYVRDLAARYLRLAHNACGATLAPTREMADRLAAAGYRNTDVLSRGVDTDRFSPARRDERLRREWSREEGGLVHLYVGRIAKEKNVDLALEAFERLRERFPRDRMVLVGDGPERERLQRAFPHAVFAGMRSGEELARYYASGDLFLFPSITETFGNVVTEAMASGLAVVAYDYAAARQHIACGANGALARLGEPSAFIEAACQLRALSGPALAALRAKARATAESISWSSVVTAYEVKVAEVIQGRLRK